MYLLLQDMHLNPIISTLFDAVFGNFSPCTAGFATSFFSLQHLFVVLALLSFFAISFLTVLVQFSFSLPHSLAPPLIASAPLF